MQQRIGLAQAFVNDPELVVLDEPTDGVDPVSRVNPRSLASHAWRGTAIFLNSHLLSGETVCDRVAIMLDGTAPARLPAELAGSTKWLTYQDPVEPHASNDFL